MAKLTHEEEIQVLRCKTSLAIARFILSECRCNHLSLLLLQKKIFHENFHKMQDTETNFRTDFGHSNCVYYVSHMMYKIVYKTL